jgi:uncharacterized protein (DUF1684 family)
MREPSKIFLLAVTALSLACSAASDGRMVSIPPPRGWEDATARHRAAKDDQFRRPDSSPLLPAAVETFSGLDYWEPDARFYFAGDVHRYAEPERFEIPTTSGGTRPCERYGWLAFSLNGELQRLQVYRLLDAPAGPGSFLLPFRDGTTGEETYPAGRYIELEGNGPFVLDFNQAYNPSCAYGDAQRFACPSTPRENTLSVRIEAGERGYERGG